jgi:AcrR family transcriptional regulator
VTVTDDRPSETTASDSVDPGTPSATFDFHDARLRERQRKRDAVLSAAASLFVSKGYNATQMEDVAAQLGVTKPAIYYYFKNKEEVLIACFERGFAALEASLIGEQGASRTGAAALRQALCRYGELVTSDFGKCTVQVSHHDLSSAGRARIAEARRRFDMVIRKLVSNAIADGSLPPQDPKIATFTVLGSLNGIGQWHKPGGELRPSEAAAQVVDLLFRGLGPCV